MQQTLVQSKKNSTTYDIIQGVFEVEAFLATRDTIHYS
jgi:hypothetical protein